MLLSLWLGERDEMRATPQKAQDKDHVPGQNMSSFVSISTLIIVNSWSKLEDSISITTFLKITSASTWTVTLGVTFLENENINFPPQSLATLNNNKGIRQNPQSHHMLWYLPLIRSKTTKARFKWQALSYPDIYGTILSWYLWH